MPSPFDEADAAAQAAFSDVLAEPVDFVGMLSTQYSRGEDPARPAQRARGIPTLLPQTGRVVGGVQGASTSSAMMTFNGLELWIARGDWAALQWVPKKDDVAILDPEGKAERHTIRGVHPMDAGDVQIVLNEGD